MTYRKKLIEVALPLDAINEASSTEKSIRHGHPSTLHLWWARRPLAACRAVLFSSLIDDPGEPGAPADYLARVDDLPPPSPLPTGYRDMDQAEKRRQKLFRFIGGTLTRTKQGNEKYTGGLVQWESSNDERILATARELIRLSCEGNPPPVLDPFCGGGSIPLEAQRLGLEAHASDLNPVAVLITKALIEIPPKFAGMPPVNPLDRAKFGVSAKWKGAAGLAADVRHYGRWMRDQAEQRIGHLYPKATLPDGSQATVIAWLWARTVTCPNPGCGTRMPLVRSFDLSTKADSRAWAVPVTDPATKTVSFRVESGTGKAREGTVGRRGAECVACGVAVPLDHVRREGRAGRMSQSLMAIVAEGARGRTYLAPDNTHVHVADSAQPSWKPEADLPHNPRDFKTPNYGLRTFADLFTPRQLVALTTFSDLVGEAREHVLHDALAAGLPAAAPSLADGGAGAHAYADAVATYLAFAVSKAANRNSSLCLWETRMDRLVATFGRQALPMVWDFAETNPFAGAGGDILGAVESVCEVLDRSPAGVAGTVGQANATELSGLRGSPMISTDPPYYDNIGYADLSDFFYIWLRRTIHDHYQPLFGTITTPKSEELVATPYRFGGSQAAARAFFQSGLARTFARLFETSSPSFPLSLFYAFKQSDSDSGDETASTGWEAMLEGVVASGFAVLGTWPMRTEQPSGLRVVGQNALASSIVLVCRPRPADAPRATRREFVSALSRELAPAVKQLKHGGIAPVDLGQAAIGPGMAVFSRYSAVLDAGDQPMSVRTALQLINKQLDEVLTETEGDFDADTRWALTWFEVRGLKEGPYGEAETLSTRFAVSVDGLRRAGVVEAGGGKVRLLSRDELPRDWDPRTDPRLTTWEVTQHMVRALLEGGEEAAATILAHAGSAAGPARDLAYRLFALCERKGWAPEAGPYNALAVAWPRLAQLAASLPAEPEQGKLV